MLPLDRIIGIIPGDYVVLKSIKRSEQHPDYVMLVTEVDPSTDEIRGWVFEERRTGIGLWTTMKAEHVTRPWEDIVGIFNPKGLRDEP